MSVTIRFASGEPDVQRDSMMEALDYVEALEPGCYCDGDDHRTLCWRTEADSVDDDGAAAFAEILGGGVS